VKGREAEYKSKIREVPDFPKKGILFYDITTLLKEAKAFAQVLSDLAEPFHQKGVAKVAAVEARGFIFGAPLARELGVGFIPIRKPGKLPADVHETSYALEYDTNVVAIHRDAVVPGESVLIVDDLLATGGTALAACELIKRCGGKVAGLAFMVELTFLKGREKLKDYPIHTLVHY
jgi:adenine phosphoribosyltransferase